METLSSKYININGSLLDLSVPCVMGILNINLLYKLHNIRSFYTFFHLFLLLEFFY